MNTTAIEAFLAIMRHGNLTEAAKALFISQSTLSHRLTELEKEVGMTLIERERGGKTVLLTDSGKEFLTIAKRWDNLVNDTRRIKDKRKDITLRIGAVDSFHAFVFPPLYKALSEHSPHINLEFRTHNSTELYMQLDRGEIDVGFPLVELPMKNIVTQKIYTEPRLVVRREMNAGNEIKLINLNELDGAEEIFFVGDEEFNARYQELKGAEGYPRLWVDTVHLLLLLLNKVGRWSILPQCIAESLIGTDDYAVYRLNESVPKRICYKIQARQPRTCAVEGLNIIARYLADVLPVIDYRD